MKKNVPGISYDANLPSPPIVSSAYTVGTQSAKDTAAMISIHEARRRSSGTLANRARRKAALRREPNEAFCMAVTRKRKAITNSTVPLSGEVCAKSHAATQNAGHEPIDSSLFAKP